MSLLLLFLSVAVLAIIYLRLRPSMRRVGPMLPDSFLFGMGLYLAGTLVVASGADGRGAFELAAMSLVATASALAGAVLFLLVCRGFYAGVDFRRQFAATDSGPLETCAIRALVLVSALVCIGFVYAVLSHSIIGALLSIASLATESSLLEARKAITAGSEGYFAPGYVKQFRDILVPIALVAMMCLAPGRRPSGLAWFGLAAALAAMLVSGQRLVFVVLFVALLIGRSYASGFGTPASGPKALPRAGARWPAVLVLLGLYALLTLLLGRTDAGAGPLAVVADIFVNLGDRVLLAAPRENLATYPVWSALGPTHGESWLADLGGVLPGASESLANVLHAATGGSRYGNSPLGLAPDVWLAWGWHGLILVPAIYAFLVGMMDLLLLTSRSALFFATKIYLFVVLPVCYSPYLFVLYGGAVAIALMLLVALLRSRALVSSPSTAT